MIRLCTGRISGRAFCLCSLFQLLSGLGLAAFATGLTLLVRRRIGIRHLVLARESAGGSNLDVISLLRIVVAFTFAVEALGALLLMARFVPLYGGLGAWASVFVSVSAFCNAGFDILSFIPGNSSLSAFNGDPLVTLTISMLIIIGSTGFVVFQDIYRKKVSTRLHRQHVEKLSFHAQVCLRASLTLLVFGTVMLFILEYNNTYRDLNFFEKLNAAFFQSVNTRTAGFASVSIKQETDGAKLLTSFLMFIGGCPGSTAGGIKVTTLVVLFAAVKSTLCGEDTTTFLRHRFDPGMVNKSLTVVAFALVVSVLNVSLILALHHGVSILDAMIEAVSAFATVGLSASPDPDAASACKACPDADDVHRPRRPCLVRRGDFNAQKRFVLPEGQNVSDRVILDPLCVLHRIFNSSRI